MKKISVVIPCYRSEKTITPVVDGVVSVFEKMPGYEYEIILVSDASPDNVFQVIQGLAATNERIKGIELSKNFGQHAAMMAGFSQCSGDIIVSMDDDGQTGADGISKLLQEIELGADVCFAKYPQVKQSVARRFGSFVNRRLMITLLSMPKTIYTNSFFACNRFVIDEICKYSGPYPYIAGLIFSVTEKITNIEVPHFERKDGISGYSFGKLISLWLNGLTAFSVKPLRISSVMGVLIAIVGLAILIYLVIKKILNPEILMGYTSTMAALLFIGGVILLALGMIGEYVGRIYIANGSKPQYVVRKTTE